MKKLLLTILIFLLAPQSYAFEDYIITSDNPVKNVFSDDDNIVSITPFYNIDNTKTIILLKAKQIGTTIVTIETTEGEAYLDVVVEEDKTILPELQNLNYFVLDVPEEYTKPKNIEPKIKDADNEQTSPVLQEKPILRGVE